jgi:hypothetical protein
MQKGSNHRENVASCTDVDPRPRIGYDIALCSLDQMCQHRIVLHTIEHVLCIRPVSYLLLV